MTVLYNTDISTHDKTAANKAYTKTKTKKTH